MKSEVSLVKGNDRKENILKSLNKIISKEELRERTQGTKERKVIIKPNLVSDSQALAATNPESVEAVIEFLEEAGISKEEIAIAEISAHVTEDIYKRLGYDKLGVELVDLEKEDEFEEVSLEYREKPISVKVSKTLLSEDSFVISLAKPKTHDCVIATLSIKNLLMGAIKNKSDMHQGIKEINTYLSSLGDRLWPDLAVIDGFEGMEGNGPTQGEEIKSNFAISSLDPLAADWVALKCMSIDPSDVGYLSYLGQKAAGSYSEEEIEIKGNEIEDCRKKYKLHETADRQLKWKE